MFNTKEYSQIYKSYINYILNNIYLLFNKIIKCKYKKKFKIYKHIKVYFDLISFKSLDILSYNNYYSINSLNLYYSINIPIKFSINNVKHVCINYNILNIPKINQIGDILLNGYTRTPILYLKTTLKYCCFRFNKEIYTKYTIYISGNNYIYIYIYNNYIYIYLKNKYFINFNHFLIENIIYSKNINININNILDLLYIFDFNKTNFENIIYYNILFNNYYIKLFYIDIILLIYKIININFNKKLSENKENIINKNIYNVYNNIFTIFKKKLRINKFIYYFENMLYKYTLGIKLNIPIFRENFLLNPSLHYTNNLSILSYLHNKFKINMFGYSSHVTSEFSVPKSLRGVQYNYVNFINILYTVDGEKCGILSTLTNNTVVLNNQLKSLFINKNKFNNKIYLDLYSKGAHKTNTSNVIFLKKNYNFKLKTYEVLENGEFKTLKLPKIKYEIEEQLNNILNITELVIPFLFNNDLCRSLMGSKMHTQALPLLNPDLQYVYTKYNKINNLLSNKLVISCTDGKVLSVTNYKIIICDQKNRLINYYLCPYNVTDYNSYLYYKPLVWPGEKVICGKILAVPSDIKSLEFTLGINNVVNYGFYYGYEHEDAIVLNKNLLFNNMLTSLSFELKDINLHYCYDKYIEILLQENNCLYKTKYDIKNIFGYKKKILKRVTRKKRRKYKDKKKLFFKKIIIYLPNNLERLIKYEGVSYSGVAQTSLKTILYFNLKLFLASINNINIGDKLCGRHGNKGTISKIIEYVDSPYSDSDKSTYIVTSPIGAISRMNVGQFLEGSCGNICKYYNIRLRVPINLINSNVYFRSLYNCFNLKYTDNYSQYLSKSILRDFKTGYKFKNFNYYVILYYFKLVHTAKTKFRYKGQYKFNISQSVYDYNINNSQKFGEMEVWSLEAHGTSYNLKELSAIKTNFKFMSKELIHKTKLVTSKTFKYLLLELKSILININYRNVYNTVGSYYKNSY